MDRLIITTQKKLDAMIKEKTEEALRENAGSLEKELLLKQADLATLQSQINPHFLYNTLECIRGKAIVDGADDIANMTHALSSFFRYSISAKSDMMTIRDEIENIRNYVLIQQFRFQNRFHVEYLMDPADDFLDAMLPKLSLQPILENAIIHGFSDITQGGIISVSIERVNNNISLIVADNGKGMDEKQLQALITKIRTPPLQRAYDRNKRHSGIALYNVDRRIKLLFGQEYGLSVTSVCGMGTNIELFFPYMKLERQK